MHFARLWTLQTLFLKLEVYIEKTYSTCEFHTGSPGTCVWLSGDLWVAVQASLFTPLAVDWCRAGPPLRGTEKPTPPFLSLWSPCSHHSQSPHLSLSTPGPHWSSLSFQSQYLVENWASLLCYLIPNSGAFPVLLGIEWVSGKDTQPPPRTCTPLHRCTM